MNSYVVVSKCWENGIEVIIKLIIYLVIEFVCKNFGVICIFIGYVLMFEDDILKVCIVKFFYSFEI